jgi:tyrosinase
MPTPKFIEDKGTPLPDWNISPAELKKQQEAFRASGMAEMSAAETALVAPKATKKSTKKGSKATAKKLSAKALASAAETAAVSPLVQIKHADLVFDRIVFERRWRGLLFATPRKRKNQKTLTATEWSVFISALNTIASPGAQSPTYQEFVNVHDAAMDMNNHAAHSWGVHTMSGMVGVNFLAWHREYLAKLEARLILVNPLVVIPYWDWVNDRTIPPQLSNASDLKAWGITRKANFNPNQLPIQTDLNIVNSKTNYAAFQTALESSPHNAVHIAVGGTMASSKSPADPLFWLHHAMVDKIWADWQATHTTAASKPPNQTDTLQPPPIITRKVSSVLNTASLGYVYA